MRVAELGVRVVRVAPVGAWIGPIDHHLGALSRVLGDLDRADHHLQRALVVEDEMNGRPYTVRTMVELAAVAKAAWRADGRSRVPASGEAGRNTSPGNSVSNRSCRPCPEPPVRSVDHRATDSLSAVVRAIVRVM